MKMNPEMVTESTTAGDPNAPYYTLNISVPENEIIDCQARKIKELAAELKEARQKEERITFVLKIIVCLSLVNIAMVWFL